MVKTRDARGRRVPRVGRAPAGKPGNGRRLPLYSAPQWTHLALLTLPEPRGGVKDDRRPASQGCTPITPYEINSVFGRRFADAHRLNLKQADLWRETPWLTFCLGGAVHHRAKLLPQGRARTWPRRYLFRASTNLLRRSDIERRPAVFLRPRSQYPQSLSPKFLTRPAFEPLRPYIGRLNCASSRLQNSLFLRY